MADTAGPKHVDAPVVATAGELPGWVRLVRAANPGPMTLDGTNTWVITPPGDSGLLVVDPGPADEGHLRAIAALGPVAAILVTHGHGDHTDGVPRLRELTGAPVVPEAPGLVRLATPGHTADSVCYVARFGPVPVVLTGDTILGRGTTVVAYPDGDLGQYLASLELLAGPDLWAGLAPAGPAGPVLVLPGHGPALVDLAGAARFYLAHRRARLEQVRAVVAAGAGTVAEIVAIVYADVDPVLWPAAGWSVRAQLAHLGVVLDLDPESAEPGVRWDTS